jgi:hypothetical protein
MAYKPKVIQGQYARGNSGIANVKMGGDHSKVKVTFEEGGTELITTEFPKELKAGRWYITLDGNNKKVFGYRPVNGVFIGKVNKFVARNDEPPMPQTHIGVKGTDGKNWSYTYFTILLEITKGENKGLIVPCVLRYHFTEAQEDEKSVVAYSHPKSKYTPMLVEFCDVSGVWEKGVMPYKDNVLPYIEKRVMHEAKEFQFVLKQGWVDSFIAIDTPITEDMPDDELEGKQAEADE